MGEISQYLSQEISTNQLWTDRLRQNFVRGASAVLEAEHAQITGMAVNNDTSFASSGASASLTAEEIAEHEKALEELSKLERQFANIELDQRR